MEKKLYRDPNNKVFAGICGGLGDYFKMDPVLIRVIWIIVVLATGVFPGVIVYIIGIFIIPEGRN